MSVIRMQNCEMCGRERKLADRDSENVGGWRELSYGNRVITMCNICIRALVEHGLERAAARATNLDSPVSARYLSFDTIENEVRKELQNAIR